MKNQKKLNIHQLGLIATDFKITVEWLLVSKNLLKVNFVIPQKYFEKERAENFKHEFSPKTHRGNWGLWDKRNVVEIFLQKRGDINDLSNTYFELQVSSNLEYFAAFVHKPRLVYSSPLHLTLTSQVTKISNNLLEVQVCIDYSQLLGDKGDLYGNFYSIIQCPNNNNQKIYAGLSLDQSELDFHLPHLFQKL
jgi:hypothetical protein